MAASEYERLLEPQRALQQMRRIQPAPHPGDGSGGEDPEHVPAIRMERAAGAGSSPDPVGLGMHYRAGVAPAA